MKRRIKATLFALLAAVGVASVASAATQYLLGEIVVDSTSGNALTIRTPGGSGITFFVDIWEIPGLDQISMGPGTDQISFGPNDGGSAAIVFDVVFGSSPNDDLINWDSKGDTKRTNDELRVRSDTLVLQSNSGDVIIQLGS